jgi:hypothetical protein
MEPSGPLHACTGIVLPSFLNLKIFIVAGLMLPKREERQRQSEHSLPPNTMTRIVGDLNLPFKSGHVYAFTSLFVVTRTMFKYPTAAKARSELVTNSVQKYTRI